MSDAGLFVGTPPPHSPTPSVASFANYNPMDGRNPGHVGPQAAMSVGADFQETAQAAKPPNYHEDTDDYYRQDQAPSYLSAIITGRINNGDRPERQNPGGSVIGGTSDNAGRNGYHNASTPYHFGGSPGHDAAGTHDAEAVREEIYRQINEEDSHNARRNLEVRLYAASQPTFANLNGNSSMHIPQSNAVVQYGQSFAGLHNMSADNSRIIGDPHPYGYVMGSPGMAPHPEVHHNSSTYDTSRDPRRRNRPQPMPSPYYAMPLPVHPGPFGSHIQFPEHIMGDGQSVSDENYLLKSSQTPMLESEAQRRLEAASSLASMRAPIATVDAPVPNFDSGPNFGSMGGPVRQFAADQAQMIAPPHHFDNPLPSPRGLRRTFHEPRDNSDLDDYERVSFGNLHFGSPLSRSTGRSVSFRNAQGNIASGHDFSGNNLPDNTAHWNNVPGGMMTDNPSSDAVDTENTMSGHKTPGGRTPGTANARGRASGRKATGAKDVATKAPAKQTQGKKAPVKKMPAKKTSTGKAPGNNIPADTLSGAQTPGNMTMGSGPSSGKTPGPASLPYDDTLVAGRKRKANNMSGGPATEAPAAKKRVTKKSSTQAAAPVVETHETPEAVETPKAAETAESSNAAQKLLTKRRGRAVSTTQDIWKIVTNIKTLQPAKAGVIVDNRALPRSFAECDEADKALVEMKEVSLPHHLF